MFPTMIKKKAIAGSTKVSKLDGNEGQKKGIGDLPDILVGWCIGKEFLISKIKRSFCPGNVPL